MIAEDLILMVLIAESNVAGYGTLHGHLADNRCR